MAHDLFGDGFEGIWPSPNLLHFLVGEGRCWGLQRSCRRRLETAWLCLEAKEPLQLVDLLGVVLRQDTTLVIEQNRGHFLVFLDQNRCIVRAHIVLQKVPSLNLSQLLLSVLACQVQAAVAYADQFLLRR